MKTSRRDFLKGIGAALVAAFVPRRDAPEFEPEPAQVEDFRVEGAEDVLFVDSSGDCETENGWWSWYDPQEHADIDQGNIFTVSDCGQKRLIVCVPAESAPGLIETLEDRWL